MAAQDDPNVKPEEASVAATQRVGPHVSSRREAFIYPERTDAAYLFVHEEDLDPMDLGELARGVQAGELAPVARREAMAIYRRIAPGPAPEAAASPSAPRPPARPPAPPGPP